MKKEIKIKCVVWDLDNTVWKGVILEDKEVALRDGIVDIIKKLDDRGILQSISSKNEHSVAMNKLEELGLTEYFLYPQINWNPKSESVKKIAESINIGIDTLAFIDDQSFEREEVNFAHSEVLCIDALDLSGLLDMPEMNPRFITKDSKKRRKMYMSDIERNKSESEFSGPNEEFLGSLGMVLDINRIQEDDLQRAEELTVRTHQLNTTGYTYSYEELDELRQSENVKIFIAGLDDRYGTYGKIGLTLIECEEDVWTIKLLLMSCRVMSRGVGSILLNFILQIAKKNNVKVRAEFVKTDRNRMMLITYKFAGFKEIMEDGNKIIFENDLSQVQEFPDYVELRTDEDIITTSNLSKIS
ncbi:MAG: HAD-IIIC family phosphatase [Halanaerobiales bacterium]|nr:HAD-IIIC family phosphatase [Halanaerobiales bacterium]